MASRHVPHTSQWLVELHLKLRSAVYLPPRSRRMHAFSCAIEGSPHSSGHSYVHPPIRVVLWSFDLAHTQDTFESNKA